VAQPNLERIPGRDDAEALKALGRAGAVVDGLFVRTLDRKTRIALARFGARSPTLALREQSADLLSAGLLSAAVAAVALEEDPRDLMVGFVLHFDAAQRLGLEPAVVFDAVAARVASPAISSLLSDFGRRDDITLGSFGWRLVEADDGPGYVHTSPAR
jgi:hypothetical protein